MRKRKELDKRMGLRRQISLLVLLAMGWQMPMTAVASRPTAPRTTLPRPSLPPPPLPPAYHSAPVRSAESGERQPRTYLPAMPAPGEQVYDPEAPPKPSDSTRGKTLFSLALKSLAADWASEASAAKLLEAEAMPREEVDKLFARVAPLKLQPKNGFKLPEPIKPPPIGRKKEVAVPFPPAAESESAAPVRTAKIDKSPLRVVRYSPEGEIDSRTNQMAVTFSQPMVPLSSVAEVEGGRPPFIKITPEAAGRWRWVDTRTVLFEPAAKAFPLAADYSVTVSAGVKSAIGNVLPSSLSWRFRTKGPEIQDFQPQTTAHSLRPHMVAMFNQPVNKQAAINKISLIVKSAGVSKPVPVTLLSDEEVRKDPYLAMVLSDKSNRYLMFRPVRNLPNGAEVEVKFAAGIPSASGPRVMPIADTRSFNIFERLEAYAIEPMVSTAPVAVSFNNDLNEKSFKPSMVQVRPPIPGAKIEQTGKSINITGVKKFGIKYSVVLSGAIEDVYGQKLGAADTVPFTVRRFEPAIFNSYNYGEPFTLAPGQSQFSLFSINYPSVKVSLYRADPSAWTSGMAKPTGKPVWSSTLKIQSRPDQVEETKVNLKPFLKSGLGHFFLYAEPAPQKEKTKEHVSLWLQSTNLAARVLKDDFQYQVIVTKLDTGKPVARAAVNAGKVSAVTDVHGVAILQGADADVVRVSLGSDVTCLSVDNAERQSAESLKRPDKLWYCFCDRGLYRPGEQVHLKGCCRLQGKGPLADLSLPAEGTSVKVLVCDRQNGKMHQSEVKLDKFGAFDVSFKVPENANTGEASVVLDEDSNWGLFSIQEFRRPEFSVSLEDVDASSPHLLGAKPTVVRLTAQYLAGGGLSGAGIGWSATGNAATYTPVGWDGYEFQPRSREGFTEEVVVGELGLTGVTGAATLQLNLKDLAVPQPVSVVVRADVEDVNRQSFSASTSVFIHPSSRYVGLKCDRWFAKAGESVDVKAVCVDIDGKSAPQSIKLQTVMLQPDPNGGPATESVIDEQVLAGQIEPLTVPVKFAKPGDYLLRATVIDAAGKPNIAEHHLDVFPDESDTSYFKAEDSGEPEVLLSADRTSYQDGDVARVAVRSPFKDAEGVMTISRGGVVSSQPFLVRGGISYVDIPIKDAYVPGVEVDFYLVESAKIADVSLDRWWTRRAAAQIKLEVPALKRTLKVDVIPEKSVTTPGANVVVDVLVKDADGTPADGSQVTLAVVDESVLMLSDYKLNDPIQSLYRFRETQSRSQDSVSNLQFLRADATRWRMESEHSVEKTGDTASSALPPPSLPPPPLPGGGAGFSTLQDAGKFAPPPPPIIDSGPAITVRSNFDPLAVFETKAVTDNGGGARVSFKLPDNLTRYRVMAFAISGARKFGTGESSFTARLPLSLRQSPPRFLNLGDKCELSFVLQNQTEVAQKVAVCLRGSSSGLIAGVGKRVNLDAGQRGEVRFPLTAEETGSAVFQSVAVSGEVSDSQEFTFPVYTPATTETVATYGTIDKSSEVLAQPFKPPSDVFTQVGGLDLSTSSTALQELTDAVVYLNGYSFECSEQLSSRIMVLATLRDVLSAFKIPGTSVTQLNSSVTGALKLLLSRQAQSGGFGYWKAGGTEYPYISLFAAEALQTCSKKGYPVDEQALLRSRQYSREIEKFLPKEYDETTKDEIRAYALYVRNLFGEHLVGEARDLLSKKDLGNCSPEFLARMLVVALDSKELRNQAKLIEQKLNNSLNETASTADCRWSAGEERYLLFQSPVRTTGLVLDALIQSSPQNVVIPKLVKGLLACRKRGAWSNTQDNAVASLALDRYFRTYEKNTPDFTARMWFGDRYLGDSQFKGRSTETSVLSMPTEALYPQWEKAQQVIICKEGQGRLYYRMGFTYAPRNLKVGSLSRGFDVSRTYEAVENPGDVRCDENGVWHVRPGALVRVRVKMTTPADRFHVALADPLPAGFEPLNPELKGTQVVASDDDGGSAPGCCWWYRSQWYEYTNLRDRRAEAFSGYLPEGEHSYSYVARATTLGTFVAPAPKAEEMYEPETFGRGKSEVVIVE